MNERHTFVTGENQACLTISSLHSVKEIMGLKGIFCYLLMLFVTSLCAKLTD